MRTQKARAFMQRSGVVPGCSTELAPMAARNPAARRSSSMRATMRRPSPRPRWRSATSMFCISTISGANGRP